MRGLEEAVLLAVVLLLILGGAFLYWWYYVKPKPAVVTPVTPTTAVVGLPTFDEAKITATVNATHLIYNASAGVLSHTITLTVSNKGSDTAKTIIAGVILPDMLRYYVNSDESGWNKLNFTGLLGSKGLYIYKDELKSSEEAKAEYTLVLYPQVPKGNYTMYFVVITLNGATEETFVKIIPVTIEVV